MADAQPWMLNNLRTAAVAQGDYPQAREATVRALALPADHTRNRHLLWNAFDRAFDGNACEAHALAESVPRSGLSSYDQFLVQLIGILETAAPGRPFAAHRGWRSFFALMPTLRGTRGNLFFYRLLCLALNQVHRWRRGPIDWLAWMYLRKDAWITRQT